MKHPTGAMDKTPYVKPGVLVALRKPDSMQSQHDLIRRSFDHGSNNVKALTCREPCWHFRAWRIVAVARNH